MNILPCECTSTTAEVAGNTIPLSSYYEIPSDVKLELGIRPEFVSFTDDPDRGMSVQLQNVDDIGRHKIASVMLGQHSINVMVAEGGRIPELNPRIVFDSERCNLYANSHRLVPFHGDTNNGSVAV